MVSVTQRIKQVKQPRGGFLPPKIFNVQDLPIVKELNPVENLHPTTIGLVVDYMSRGVLENNFVDAFKISFLGAALQNKEEEALTLLSKITDLSDTSLTAASLLVSYDAMFRAGVESQPLEDRIILDKDTLENLRVMIERTIDFFKKFGPVTATETTFEGAYTDIVSAGDGDFLTKYTIWDMKVSKAKITSAHTLQILMYYLLAKKSKKPMYADVENLGFFNPRLNTVYTLPVKEVSSDILKIVSEDILGLK